MKLVSGRLYFDRYIFQEDNACIDGINSQNSRVYNLAEASPTDIYSADSYFVGCRLKTQNRLPDML